MKLQYARGVGPSCWNYHAHIQFDVVKAMKGDLELYKIGTQTLPLNFFLSHIIA